LQAAVAAVVQTERHRHLRVRVVVRVDLERCLQSH
jgi:hypothetical protein